jgi:hypothetical protein
MNLKLRQKGHNHRSATAAIARVLLLLSVWGIGAACDEGAINDPFRDVKDVAALDAQSLFTFAIFSDNKGTGPASGIAMAGMVDGVEEMGARFVLGLGDHLQGSPLDTQDFPGWVTTDVWWANHFYPVIADGENNYYGTGQGDWGAGNGLTDELGLCDQPDVICRDNHAEYHAVLAVGDVTVHFIAAHYPDSGVDPFPADSRQYLVDEVQSIERTGREIIIAAAHTGDWLQDLSEDQRSILLQDCDLLLGATTHVYKRYDYPNDAALFLNTGSTGYSLWNNYLQVNVLDAPLRLVVQSMKAVDPRFLQEGENCWVKEVGGLITPCDFTHGEPWPPLFPE